MSKVSKERYYSRIGGFQRGMSGDDMSYITHTSLLIPEAGIEVDERIKIAQAKY